MTSYLYFALISKAVHNGSPVEGVPRVPRVQFKIQHIWTIDGKHMLSSYHVRNSRRVTGVSVYSTATQIIG